MLTLTKDTAAVVTIILAGVIHHYFWQMMCHSQPHRSPGLWSKPIKYIRRPQLVDIRYKYSTVKLRALAVA